MLSAMRGLDTIDSELRLLAAVRWSIHEHGGGEPSPWYFSQFCSVNRNHTSQSPPQQGSPPGVQYCVPSGAMQGGAP
jgi:hypothetical protein